MQTNQTSRIIALFLMLLTGFGSSSLRAQSVTTPQAPHLWPRNFTNASTAFTVYQPQATSWTNGILKFRVAVSVTPQGAAQPTFGTVKLMALTTGNPDGTTVALSDVAVVKANFPSAPDLAAGYGSQIATQSGLWGKNVSMQAITANLAVTLAESSKPKTTPVQNNPPTFYFSQTPAILVLIDGQPALRPVMNSPLLRVINTQALILLDQTSGLYYLRVNGGWQQSQSISGPWSLASNPPATLDAVLQQITSMGNLQLYNPQSGSTPSAMPTIYVSLTPAELITTQGPPTFQPVSGTQLLQASNTSSSLFMDVTNQTYYLVISGRWFSATALNGTWQFVPSSKLPSDFSSIPENAPAGTVLASVAGTSQAQEAAIAQNIPQTARIARTASTTVNYSGAPQFQKIRGTSLSYAINTATPVIRAGSKYFAVVNGVWFKSATPAGPWVVADKVPQEIYTIPPSCPIYYATNVYIYAATPEYVNVGYTPGYYGTCLSPDGVVVYGTGYDYVPFIGASEWIAPPLTYGFGAGIACGLATGFAFGMAFDHGWGCSPGWGPWGGGWGGWSGGNTYNNNWNNVNANQNNVYNHWGQNNLSNPQNFQQAKQNFDQNHPQAASDMNRAEQNFQQNHPAEADRIRHQANEASGLRGNALSQQQRQNLQNAEQNHPQASQDLHNDAHRDAENGEISRNSLSHDSSHLGENNVFAGRDGNAYRSSSEGGWQQHDGSGWKNTDNSFSHGDVGRDLNNQRFARNAGSFRDSGFSGGRSFGGGGFRGGGGGFRR